MKKICKNCGEINPYDAIWCIKCSHELNNNTQLFNETPNQETNNKTLSEKEREKKDLEELQKYISTIKHEKNKQNLDLPYKKIALIFIFIFFLVSVFFIVNQYGTQSQEFNWEGYGMPWDSNSLPGMDEMPWDGATFTLEYPTTFTTTSEINTDFWFEGNNIQTNKGFTFEIKTIQEYTLEGIVLAYRTYSKNDYTIDHTTLISPIDMFIGINNVQTNPNDYPIKIKTYHNRVIWWEFQGTSQTNCIYLRKNSGNNHIIPHNQEVLNQLKNIDLKDKILIQGSLVNIYWDYNNMNYKWTTDTKIGNTACEVILVDSITILN